MKKFNFDLFYNKYILNSNNVEEYGIISYIADKVVEFTEEELKINAEAAKKILKSKDKAKKILEHNIKIKKQKLAKLDNIIKNKEKEEELIRIIEEHDNLGFLTAIDCIINA